MNLNKIDYFSYFVEIEFELFCIGGKSYELISKMNTIINLEIYLEFINLEIFSFLWICSI